ncbi:MAG: CBS domain-containing protein [Methanobacterium sp.]|uniref:CBS domain-containing protein n=2 Tax=Methanobacteriaceae TaxID=2159 RepID=A0A2H4VTQ8_9EURY|nr:MULTISPECIES: CBS domain-containing protein [Methanobacterium]MBW4258411.1 CBS domain-containing protein [Methanobacterium sp. YSL]AUB56750.1 inosine-5-monophosphate dehydrogenase [Methanobacterium subterraneum]AUB59067.1 inosine-5-monophosphate dehydrogenase [Methanobacterium sp. MZ-A1]AUB61493.1 inosine-5-monophosphate dehydrogenase [Methanobacterium subterraneum]MCC7561117.1 CBS domain-containing protein [Methanobacterium sp.]
MKIEDVMNEEVILAEENEQVSHARNLMLKHGYSRILVVDPEGKPVGILTEKDLTRKMRSNGPKWKRRTIDKISIRRVMTPNPVTITPFREVREAVELMIKNDISSIPVTDGDEVVGIITKSELMDFYRQKYTGKWKVSDLMSSEVVTVNENHSIGHVISIMGDQKIGKVIVVRDNEPVGIITSANISFANMEDPETGVSVEKIAFLRKIDGQEKRNVREVSMVTAGDIMTNHLIKIEQGEDAASAADIMAKKEVSGMPVVGDDELVGIITKTDIIRGIQ